MEWMEKAEWMGEACATKVGTAGRGGRWLYNRKNDSMEGGVEGWQDAIRKLDRMEEEKAWIPMTIARASKVQSATWTG